MQARRANVPKVLGTDRDVNCRDCGSSFTWKVHAGMPPSRCAPCKIAARKAAKKKYLASNPRAREVERAGARRRYKADPVAFHVKNRARRYGVTVEWIMENEAKGCAICGSKTTSGRGWAIDHDHVTGKVRGVLCNHCNAGIGQLRDDPDLILRAAQYVRKHRQQALDV